MMALNKAQALGHLREIGRSVFTDFITGLPAHNEIEFSAALAVLQNGGRIDWTKVNLYSGSELPLDSPRSANEMIAQDSVAMCEYPLFSLPGSAEEKRWGAFRADVLFLAKDRSKITYVENKIGAGIRQDLITGTIECLDRSCSVKPSFIILTGQRFFEAKWYRGELGAALAELGTARKNVSAHIMFWEEVFNACHAAA